MCKFCQLSRCLLCNIQCLVPLNLLNLMTLESIDITNVLPGPHHASCPCSPVFVFPPALIGIASLVKFRRCDIVEGVEKGLKSQADSCG